MLKLKQALILASLLPALATAEIYKWTDASGKVHFSDKPPAGVKAEKKTYQSVTTQWRQVPKDIYAKPESAEQPAQAPTGDVPSADAGQQSSQPVDDGEPAVKEPREKRNKSIKGKADKEQEEGKTSRPVKLRDQDKAAVNSPTKRAKVIKARNEDAKKRYRATASSE